MTQELKLSGLELQGRRIKGPRSKLKLASQKEQIIKFLPRCLNMGKWKRVLCSCSSKLSCSFSISETIVGLRLLTVLQGEGRLTNAKDRKHYSQEQHKGCWIKKSIKKIEEIMNVDVIGMAGIGPSDTAF
jgi:hypothetical protein